MKFLDTRLYSCGREGGDIAGRVRWNERIRLITFFNPGGRQRAYEVREVLEDSEAAFIFIDQVGRRFELRELTPDFYNEQIRREHDPLLHTEAELLEAFQRSQDW